MGIGYLSRVAGRGLPAAGSVARAPGVPAKPAIASRSPVAEADQRLHLEGFEGVFISAHDVPADEITHDFFTSLPDESSAADALEVPKAAQSQTAAPTGRHAAERQSSLARSDKSKPRSEPASPSAARQGLSDDRPLSAAVPTVHRPTAVTRVDSSPDSVEPGATKNEAADALAASPTVSQSRPIRTAGTAQITSASQPSSESTAHPVTAAPTDALTKQLAALEHWLEGPQESQTSPAEAGHTDEGQPVTKSTTTARSARSAYVPQVTSSAGLESQSRLEIGSIEVEVIAPAKVPVSQERPMPHRPQRSAEHVSHARPFGWRQR